MNATGVTYSEEVRTRYAPTPSGYLHQGNAAHFLVVSRVASERGADTVLRIDDMDDGRFREDYLHDIFDLLGWLDLRWQLGPRSAGDMTAWRQATRLDRYQEAFTALNDKGLIYACECSRTEWRTHTGHSCPRNCRARGVQAREASFRLHLASLSRQDELAGITDPVIWRRDDLPAYHLTSVVDDDLWGIDLVVRGADLRESTAVQLALSASLPASQFRHATVLHHDVIADAHGSKLSKSSGSGAEPLARTDQVKAEILELADELYESLVSYRPRSSGN